MKDFHFYYNGSFSYGLVDEFGKPIQRTPITHPYTYEGYVEKRLGKNSEATGTVYSDRLRQWDYKKAKACQFNAFGKETDYFSSFSEKQIETYLSLYFNEPRLKLILVMNYCNQSSGYPVWRFDYRIPKDIYVPLSSHQDYINNRDLDPLLHQGFTIGKKGNKMYWEIVWHPSGNATIYGLDGTRRWVPNETMITIHFK